jgi:hypothetical protein
MEMIPGPPMPWAPWFKIKYRFNEFSGFSVAPPAPENFLPAIVQHVSVKSEFSANPGVLASGRRPERPEIP